VKRMFSFVVVMLGVWAATAQAGTVVCSGTIETLQFDATSTGSGQFSIKLSSMNVPVYFCDPDSSFSAAGSGYSISPATCRALYATFLSAKAAGATITDMYFDGSAVPASCNTWTTWQAANIRHYLY